MAESAPEWREGGSESWGLVSDGLRRSLGETYDWACTQIEATARRLEGTGEFPHVTDGGRWRTWRADVFAGWNGDQWSHGNWTAGFWVGLLWLAFYRTGQAQFEEWARYFCRLMEGRSQDFNTHDVGYLFYPSFVLGFELTADRPLRDAALVAADTLAARFNPRGRYIQAWGPMDLPLARRSTAIDTMMNLPLLWWARHATGHARYAEIAGAHAETSLRYYLRPDGSTYHTYSFDPDTGEPLGGGTYQGASAESAWSRGMAWGIYGWALAYKEHRAQEFLSAADRAAEYYLGHLPPDMVPPWDFADTDPGAPRDSSASAVCAGALLELAGLHPDPAMRQRYAAAAGGMLASLNGGYTAKGRPGQEGILLHAVYSKPHGDAVDSSVMWGDWFFLRTVADIVAGPIPVP